MSAMTPKQAFALEEFRSLRREIDATEEILDRLFKRALTIVAICYLLLIFKHLPFSNKPLDVPERIQWLLQYLPLLVVATFWIDAASRHRQIKAIASYIEHIELDFYFDERKGWEEFLRVDEGGNILRRNRHHLNWLLLFVVTSIVSSQIDRVTG